MHGGACVTVDIEAYSFVSIRDSLGRQPEVASQPQAATITRWQVDPRKADDTNLLKASDQRLRIKGFASRSRMQRQPSWTGPTDAQAAAFDVVAFGGCTYGSRFECCPFL